AMLAGEERQDAVGFTVVQAPQHHGIGLVSRHSSNCTVALALRPPLLEHELDRDVPIRPRAAERRRKHARNSTEGIDAAIAAQGPALDEARRGAGGDAYRAGDVLAPVTGADVVGERCRASRRERMQSSETVKGDAGDARPR